MYRRYYYYSKINSMPHPPCRLDVSRAPGVSSEGSLATAATDGRDGLASASRALDEYGGRDAHNSWSERAAFAAAPSVAATAALSTAAAQ